MSDDGNGVACVESRPSGHRPKNDVMRAVLAQGKLVTAYRPQDFVENHEGIGFRGGHYRWLVEESQLRCKTGSR